MEQLLKVKFGDCKYAITSLCNAKSSYQNINEKEFYIFDPPSETNQPVRIVNAKDEHQLIVSNLNEKTICLVKTDKCLFHHEVSKCDCILIAENKVFFVEIKDTKKAQRHANRAKAIEQLENTLKSVIEQQIELSNFAVKAIICFKSAGNYPTQASKNTSRAIFQEDYNVSLEEGNTIEF